MRLVPWLALFAATLLASPAPAQVDPGMLDAVEALRNGGQLVG